MNKLLFTLAQASMVCLILFTACSQQQATESTFAGLPAGSYEQTCKNCYISDPSGKLCCYCYESDARILLKGSCVSLPCIGELINDTGDLKCLYAPNLCDGKPVWFVTSKKYSLAQTPFTLATAGDKAVRLDNLDAECAAQAASLNTIPVRTPLQWKAIILAGDATGRLTVATVKANQFAWDQQTSYCAIPRTAVDPLNCEDRVILSDGSLISQGEKIWFGPNFNTSGPRCNPPKAASLIIPGLPILTNVCGGWANANPAGNTAVMVAPSMGLSTATCSDSLRLLCAAQF